jgi:hypothetical protein
MFNIFHLQKSKTRSGYSSELQVLKPRGGLCLFLGEASATSSGKDYACFATMESLSYVIE